MTPAVAKNRERGLAVEDLACERYPCEPVAEDPDERSTVWYDVEFVESVEVPLAGVIVPAGAVAEVKSCVDHYPSEKGRWWINRDPHERLVASDGWYILAVVSREDDDELDAGDIRRMALVEAGTLDEKIGGEWWDCGNGGRTADQYVQLAWSNVFDRLGADVGGASE